MKLNNPVVNLMKNYIKNRNSEKLNDLLSQIHVYDLKKRISKLETPLRKAFFNMLDSELLSNLFAELESEEQLEVLSWLEDTKKTQLFNCLPTDDIVDIIGKMESDEAQKLLSIIENREEIERLLHFDIDTAAGLLTTEFIALNYKLTSNEGIREIKQWTSEAETIYYIYVVDEDNHLMGVLSLRELLSAETDQKLEEIMRTNVVKVQENTDQEEIAHIIAKYDLIAVPVVDHDNKLVGIITVDDIVDVIEEEASEDLFKQAGFFDFQSDEAYRSERLINANVPTALRLRLPWLVFAMVGGLFAGGVMGHFEETLESIVALAFFVPVIMDMGGNVGTQSSTILVRGLALGQIELPNFIRYLAKEVLIGIVLGIISAVVVGIVAYFWQGIYELSLVVSASMFCTIVLATTIGYIIPWLVMKLGGDPAAASNPLITTAKDVTGLIIYFAFASLFLARLL